MKSEYDHATGEAKSKLKAKIDAMQKKMQAQRDRLHEKIADFKREDEAKIKSLEEHASMARNEVKSKVEKRLSEARTRHEERQEKLKEAWEKVKEAAAV